MTIKAQAPETPQFFLIDLVKLSYFEKYLLLCTLKKYWANFSAEFTASASVCFSVTSLFSARFSVGNFSVGLHACVREISHGAEGGKEARKGTSQEAGEKLAKKGAEIVADLVV